MYGILYINTCHKDEKKRKGKRERERKKRRQEKDKRYSITTNKESKTHQNYNSKENNEWTQVHSAAHMESVPSLKEVISEPS